MWMSPLVALTVLAVLAVGAALLARRAPALAIVFGAAGFLGVPWLAGSIPLLRALAALLGGVLLLRIIDLVRSREPWGAGRRLLHVASFVDSRTLRPAPRHFDVLCVGRALLWALLAAAGFHYAHSSMWMVRWAGGLVFVYCAIEAGYEVFGAQYRALGFITPRLHDLPVASLSVTELWGTRWARPVSAWLRETCFRPFVRRRRPKVGLVIAFIASASGHAYPIFVAVDLPMATMMFSFFALQAMFVVIEAMLGASRWPRPARRGWTIVLMVGSSPLFVEPALRVLGM